MIRRIIGRFGTPLFFLVVLIAFVVVLSVISSGHPKDWNETTGVIRKIETEVEYGPGNERNETNHVYVEYTVDGKKYDRELGVYMPSYKEGMELKILVDPADPRSGRTVRANAGTGCNKEALIRGASESRRTISKPQSR